MKKEYLKLKEEFSLPDYDLLNDDFEIYTISKEDNLIREIIKKMSGVVDFYIDVLEDIIQPDSRFYTLKEANVLNKDERRVVSLNYSKLMYLNRRNLEIHLDFSEAVGAEFISNLFDEWQNIKKELLPIIIKLKESWLIEQDSKPVGGYFG
ncbi:MAG: hypothetical protein ACLFN8_05215 [Candidatus Woesearchaeota archaeon]